MIKLKKIWIYKAGTINYITYLVQAFSKYYVVYNENDKNWSHRHGTTMYRMVTNRFGYPLSQEEYDLMERKPLSVLEQDKDLTAQEIVFIKFRKPIIFNSFNNLYSTLKKHAKIK